MKKNGYLLFPNLKVGALETRVCPNCGAGVEVMIGYYANCPLRNRFGDDGGGRPGR